MPAIKHLLQDIHLAGLLSPLLQRFGRPGSRINGLAMEM